MQHLLVALQQEKSSCNSIFIFAVSLFGYHLALDARAVGMFTPPLCTPLGTVGYFQKAFNHVWASQAKLNMYEIEK